VIVLAIVPLVVLIVALFFGYYLPQRRRRERRHAPIALAPFGHGEATSLPPRPSRSVVPPASERAAPPRAASGADDLAAAPTRAAAAPPPPPPQQRPVEARRTEELQSAAEESGRVLRLQVSGERRDSVPHDHRSIGAATLRLERPFDGTLQFLPGRLEIIEGREVGQELKFVRTPGPDGTTVTFGRSAGPAYRHVQLNEATVSRLHAKITLDGKTWSLHNLSATNPVVVNGMPLAGEGTTVVLREGDRIEMGEVVLRFRAR